MSLSAELSGVYALRGFLKIHCNSLTCDEFCSGIGLIVDNSTQSPIQSWVVVTCSLSILLVRGDHCVRDWILPTSFPTFPYCPLLRLLPAPTHQPHCFSHHPSHLAPIHFPNFFKCNNSTIHIPGPVYHASCRTVWLFNNNNNPWGSPIHEEGNEPCFIYLLIYNCIIFSSHVNVLKKKYFQNRRYPNHSIFL